MKITVELSDNEMKEVCKTTGEKKKGPAIRRIVVEALQERRKRDILDKFVTGEWSADVPGFEARRKAGREEAKQNRAAWKK